jgi:hypothetical protein
MKALQSFDISELFVHMSQHHIPEDLNFQQQCCHNLRSQSILALLKGELWGGDLGNHQKDLNQQVVSWQWAIRD